MIVSRRNRMADARLLPTRAVVPARLQGRPALQIPCKTAAVLCARIDSTLSPFSEGSGQYGAV